MNLYKNFYDNLEFLNNPEKYFFVSSFKYGDNSTLIKRDIPVKEEALLTWISENDIDVGSLMTLAKKEKVIIDNLGSVKYINVPENCKITKLGCAIVCERLCEDSHNDIASVLNIKDINIREANSNDLDFLVSIKADTTYHDYVSRAIQVIQDKCDCVFLLLINNEIKSFLIIGDIVSKNHSINYKDISAIYTTENARKQGLAKFLIQWVINNYSNNDFLYVIDTEDNIASKRLAESCGFSIIGYRVSNLIECTG